ncbi:hypothetical protein A2U01_0109204, partial [Trifolium medium]|nr:hypothetical protein [Trifolium medium]
MRDEEGSCTVAPKKYGYENLVCYVPFEAEEMQNLVSKIFREAIGNNSNQTLKLIGLL